MISIEPTLNWDARPAGSEPPVERLAYMSRVTGRTPEWRAHSTLKAARCALSVRRFWERTELQGAREIWEYSEPCPLWEGGWALVESR